MKASMKHLKISSGMMIFLIILSNVVPPLSIDEFTPSMPHMVHALGTTVPLMQLSITFYLLAFAIAQIILGFLSDSFGRRPILLWTLPVFLIGSVVCIFSSDITMLLIGRVLQGAGVAGSALTAPALMADCFEGEELTKVSGYFGTAYSFIPIAAPIIGGFVQEYINWQANFVVMLVLGILSYLIFLKFLPETHKPEAHHQVSARNILKGYVTVLTNGRYMSAVACLVFVWTLFMVFSIMAPFIMQVRLGLSPSIYGTLALLIGLGFFFGNTANNFIIKKLGSKKTLALGMLIMLVASIVLLLFSITGLVNVWTIMTPIFIIMCGGGMSFPNLYGIAISSVTTYAGIAGALIGSLILVGATIITALITMLHAHSATAMSTVYVVLSAITFLIVIFNKAK